MIDARFADVYPNGLAEFTLNLTLPLLRHLTLKGNFQKIIILRMKGVQTPHPKVSRFWSEIEESGACIICAPPPLTVRALLWEVLFCFRFDIKRWLTYHFNIPLVFKGKSAAIIHDMMPLALPGYLKGQSQRLKALYFRAMVGWLMKNENGIIFTPSRFTVKEMRLRLGFSPRNWALLKPGISDDLNFREQCKWMPPPVLKLFFIGERRPHKNVLRLIGIGRLLSKQVQCEIIIAGKNKDYHFSLNEELWGPVRYVGEISDSVKRELMLQASYVVLLSDYEGYGMPIAEANALGVPALTSANTVMCEMCSESDCIVDLSSSDEMIVSKILKHWRTTSTIKEPQPRRWNEVARELIKKLDDEQYFDCHCL